jgi:hypothetical protein
VKPRNPFGKLLTYIKVVCCHWIPLFARFARPHFWPWSDFSNILSARYWALTQICCAISRLYWCTISQSNSVLCFFNITCLKFPCYMPGICVVFSR